MIIGIDHVLIAVEDVDRAMETYRRLGFMVHRGGVHPRMGTYNALIPLADGCYLELIGIKERARADQFPHTRKVVSALEGENRLAGFALDSNDLDGEVKAVRERGLAIGDPLAGERVRPDDQRVVWRTAHCEDVALPFLIQDVTPRELRIPAPKDGIGRGLRVAAVSVQAQDVKARWTHYASLLGMMSTAHFDLARGAIHLQAGERDELMRVTLTAEQGESILDYWRTRDVAFQKNQVGGHVRLAPLETLGAAIDIVI